MREILFRGKRADKSEWIEGDLRQYINMGVGYEDFYEIDTMSSTVGMGYSCKVIPETVGQYTGLTDKNGIRIFEGDIVCVRYTNGDICAVGDVQYDCGTFGAEWVAHKEHKTMVGSFGQRHNLRTFEDDIINDIEIIGNIHDNPELLKP